MQIRFVPTACAHFRVVRESDGQVIDTPTLVELQEAPREQETLVRLRLKFLIRDFLSTGSALTVSNIRQFMEARDF